MAEYETQGNPIPPQESGGKLQTRRDFFRDLAIATGGFGALTFLLNRGENSADVDGSFVYVGETAESNSQTKPSDRDKQSWIVDVASGNANISLIEPEVLLPAAAAKNVVLGTVKGVLEVPAGCENLFVYQGAMKGVTHIHALEPQADEAGAKEHPLRIKFDTEAADDKKHILSVHFASTKLPNIFYYNDQGVIVSATRSSAIQAEREETLTKLDIGGREWKSSSLDASLLVPYQSLRNEQEEATRTTLGNQYLSEHDAVGMQAGMLHLAPKALDRNWKFAPNWQANQTAEKASPSK